MSVRVRIYLGFLFLALVAFAGCHHGPGVRKVKSPPLYGAWQASAIGQKHLSPRTLQTLRQLDLEEAYVNDPYAAFGTLHELTVKAPNKDLLFALAEISYAHGRNLEKKNNCEAVAYYYLCAGYSYHYLFGNYARTANIPIQNEFQAEEAFDPRFRLACDLYNMGLAKCIRAAQEVGRLDPRQQLQLPTGDGGGFTLSVTHHGFAWKPDEFGPLQPCSDFEVVGLANHFRTFGLGVPLIGNRIAAANSAPGQAFYPKEVSFPVTAFFRFEGTVADLGARRVGRLELYNPLAARKILVEKRVVPLETDLTTPLAHFLSRTDLNGVELAGFFRADNMEDRTGIYMFEPYQPGKIPVIMVHGLLSSPLTWTSLFNELRADPALNQRYQFWFYLYPSGNPYLATAADLRIRLQHMRQELDPHRQDPALEQTVMVGHSMGGLISKLQTQDSGNDYWQMVSHQPFDALKASSMVKHQLQQVFFFQPQPSVKRVIFMATPHRGSNLGPFPGRLLSKLVRLPKHLITATEELITENSDIWKFPAGEKQYQRVPTSIDMLNPGSPALMLLAAREAPPGVRYHSIIGTYKGKGPESHDGVVQYQSAHLDGVESELVVPSHHIGLHHHPLALLEVRRILHKHLQEVDAQQTVVPAFRPADAK